MNVHVTVISVAYCAPATPKHVCSTRPERAASIHSWRSLRHHTPAFPDEHCTVFTQAGTMPVTACLHQLTCPHEAKTRLCSSRASTPVVGTVAVESAVPPNITEDEKRSLRKSRVAIVDASTLSPGHRRRPLLASPSTFPFSMINNFKEPSKVAEAGLAFNGRKNHRNRRIYTTNKSTCELRALQVAVLLLEKRVGAFTSPFFLSTSSTRANRKRSEEPSL